ncbi:unnamed protein product, partial [Ectocarpus sp. 6 AP-2014]
MLLSASFPHDRLLQSSSCATKRSLAHRHWHQISGSSSENVRYGSTEILGGLYLLVFVAMFRTEGPLCLFLICFRWTWPTVFAMFSAWGAALHVRDVFSAVEAPLVSPLLWLFGGHVTPFSRWGGGGSHSRACRRRYTIDLALKLA